MKRILGLDLGTNSIGWALVEQDFEKKEGKINGLGSRIIPMDKAIMDAFGSGGIIKTSTAERTEYRGTRRLYQRNILRRERLHRVMNILNFLPEHYLAAIDFEKHFGQFKDVIEVKLNYRKSENGKHEFIFKDAFLEMVAEFKNSQPQLFSKNKKGEERKIPHDWTIYYLRKKALTQEISKEELAWIILNFNQKRGYYQLRGEENEEEDKFKNKEFVTLKVQSVNDSGDKIKGSNKTLFDIVFKNGWKYDKQIVVKEEWLNKKKEFIVTTHYNSDGSIKLDKDGNIKRTFKKVDSEQDWLAIKKKTEQTIDSSKETVGAFIYKSLLANPSQKIRGKLIKIIERKYYKDELKKILTEQAKYHAEFNDSNLYKACIEELYPRNEAHQNNIKDKDLIYLFLQDIIFYQRPLKTKKSTIANCQYESRFYKNADGETKEVPLKGVSKSHPLFQEFRLWQFLGNLKIYDKIDKEVTKELLPTEEAWVELFKFLNTKKEIEQHQVLKYFSDKKLIIKQPKNDADYRWNYVQDKKYPCNETRIKFVSRLKKVEGIDIDNFLTAEVENHLWHIVYSVKDKIEFEQAVKTFADRYSIDVDSFVENFKKLPPFKNDYSSYSYRALSKIVPLMRMGEYWTEEDLHKDTTNRIDKLLTGEYDEKIKDRVREKTIHLNSIEDFRCLPTWFACYVVYDRHSESKSISKWKSPKDIDAYLKEFKQHSLRNPIVEQVITETLRIVRDIWSHYGEGAKDFFNEIHIELGREMKNPAKKRKKLTEINNENEKTNQRIKAILQELRDGGDNSIKPYSPSQQEILKIYDEDVYQSLEKVDDNIYEIRKKTTPTKKDIKKYKLWLDQKYVSPYTGKSIPLSGLFTEAYQIEHIIPQSRYFDNSFSNKIICESAVNQEKDNTTAYEFLKRRGGERIDLGQGNSVPLFSLEEYKNHCNSYFKKDRNKLSKLLSEDIPEGFIERQLNDTRYISKLVKGLLSNIVREEGEQEATSKHIVPVIGRITSELKQDWGLNDVWNKIVEPRFKRLNELTQTNDFGYIDEQMINGKLSGKKFFRTMVPDAISKRFSKKRIDHRHHALDAVVIACCTEDIQLTNQKGEMSKRTVAKEYHKPWPAFTTDVHAALEKMIVSFKKNTRVLTKTNNYTQQWKQENGQWKKKSIKQTKGDNRAIRKPLHKETVYGKVQLLRKGKIIDATAGRIELTEKFTSKHLESVTDTGIQKILTNHVKNYIDETGKECFDLAFNLNGVYELNKNIIELNSGKLHQPIRKLRIYEVGNKFAVGYAGSKKSKYVEAAKGTNLYFAIYQGKNKKGNNVRQYDTVPLNEVIERLKQGDSPVPEKYYDKDKNEYSLLFSLSPNDLVYIPTDEEIENPNGINFQNATKTLVSRLMVVNDFSGVICNFTPIHFSTHIRENEVDYKWNEKKRKVTGHTSKTTNYENKLIKMTCWKVEIDGLGNIKNVVK